MARATARKIAGKTAAAAKRMTTRRATGTGAGKKATAAKTTATKKASTKAPATKTAAKKSTAKKSTAKKAPASTAVTRKAPAKKASTAKKAPATKATAKKATAKKATATKAPAKKATATKAPAKKTTAKTTPAKKAAAAQVPAAKKAPAKQATKKLAVKADEKPWTKKELDEVRGELIADRERLAAELNLAEHELHDLMRDAGDGAGNDQADVGSTTFERDHEMTLANNARGMLSQTNRALARIEHGTYGVCERCGEPIGKMRLMAFPRATLCLPCKQREERR
jgi:RNA polymerase-binding protein DksA